MSVNTGQVRHIARLARIAMNDKELERLAPELNNILGWVEQLGEVNTDGIEPLTAAIDINRSYKLQANSYLSKPVQLDKFESIVRIINNFLSEKAKIPQPNKEIHSLKEAFTQ